MTKSTRRRTKCATCGNEYNARGDHGSCPYCSGAKPPPGETRKANKKGFVNYGGGPTVTAKTPLGKKLAEAFEKGKGKP